MKTMKIETWYTGSMLVGIVGNIIFGLAAFFAPSELYNFLGLIYANHGEKCPWLQNTAIVLIYLSLTYWAAAFDPARYAWNAYIAFAARFTMGLFWLALYLFFNYPVGFLYLALGDLAIAIVQGILLLKMVGTTITD